MLSKSFLLISFIGMKLFFIAVLIAMAAAAIGCGTSDPVAVPDPAVDVVLLRVFVADKEGLPVKEETVWARHTDDAQVTDREGKAILTFPASANTLKAEIHAEAGFREEIRIYEPPISSYAAVYIIFGG